MINAELLSKIKAEIEILRANTSEFNYQNAVGYNWALDDVLSFLSTLESEKPMNPDDAMKELDEKIALVKQRGTWDGVDVDKYMDEVRGREPEKSMNLEEEINRYLHEECSNDDEPSVHEIAEHFAQWGAEHAKKEEPPVSDNLEEAAEKYAKTTFKKPYSDNPDEEVTIVELDKYAGFIAGAKWQREQGEKELSEKIAAAYQLGLADKEKQMMSEAVEKTVGQLERQWGGNIHFMHGFEVDEIDFPFLNSQECGYGDKVRIIIVKEDLL